MKIDSLLATAGKNGLTVSLDVSDWSPNMIRENEMEFCDMLLTFYNVPNKMSISKVFSEISAVTSGDGYHDKWMTTNESIRGFFGSADTILHSMIGQFALACCRSAGLVGKKSKVQKITLIDDIIIAISDAPRNRRTILNYICNIYRNLGFEPDLVKTLMAATKGNFLNRLYSGSFEVITAAKIFAKADREWERSMSTVWNRVNTVMRAFRGASDRGANPALCYLTAIWRCMTIVYQSGGKGYRPDTALSTVFAWLTPALGGYGLPNFSHWGSRTTENPVTAGLATVCRIARTVAGTIPGLYTAIHNL